MRQSVSLKAQETVSPRVKLAPFRTFREVAQPTSEFLIRLQKGSESAIPEIGLFEADGGEWKIDAAENIQAVLLELLGEKAAQYPVIR